MKPQKAADRRLGRHIQSYMDRAAYTRLWGELLAADYGDQFTIRYYQVNGKTFVERSGEILALDVSRIDFTDEDDHWGDGMAAGQATVVFACRGTRYKARLNPESTPVVKRYGKKGDGSKGWIRDSYAVSGALVAPDRDGDSDA